MTVTKKPRQNQRFPAGGLEIYDRAKAGECSNVLVFLSSSEISDKRLACGDALSITESFDPMLYFWPVDGCYVIAHVSKIESSFAERLVKAMERDGVGYILLAQREPWATKGVGDWERYDERTQVLQRLSLERAEAG